MAYRKRAGAASPGGERLATIHATRSRSGRPLGACHGECRALLLDRVNQRCATLPPCGVRLPGGCALNQDEWAHVRRDVRPLLYRGNMKPKQQALPLKTWGGTRRGAGRKQKAARKSVPHRPRRPFRRGVLHVTTPLRAEVWNLRSHRCFRALRRAFAGGCARFGFRLVHFSVQGNHVHTIVEAPDAVALGRAMKGLEVRMARALNKVMRRRGKVFADRYHAHLLKSPREAANAIRYVLENWRRHGLCGPGTDPRDVDPYCSTSWHGTKPALTAVPEGWMLCIGIRLAEPGAQRNLRPVRVR